MSNKDLKSIWTSSAWKAETLKGESVEYWIRTREGIEHGTGTLRARRNSQGLLAVEIVNSTLGSHQNEAVDRIYFIPQSGVDVLERHPDPSVAAFRLKDE